MSATDLPNQEEFEELLKFLDELQVSDPEKYREIMTSMEAQLKNMPAPSTSIGGESKSEIRSTTDLAAAMKKLKEEEILTGVDQDKNIIIKDKKPEVKGIKITPIPCFTMKTHRLTDNSKVFINILQHENIEKPRMVKKLDDEGKEIEGMNIPLSISSIHIEKDKNDTDCAVYDVVVNNEVIDDCTQDVKYKEFLCQLALQSLEQKYNEQLDKRYKLPKLSNNYMGKTVIEQYIQDRKKMAKIEEISSTSDGKENQTKSTAKGKKNDKQQEVKVIEKELLVSSHWLIGGDDVRNSLSCEQLIDTFEQALAATESSDSNDVKLVSTASYDGTDGNVVIDISEYMDPVIEPPRGTLAVIISADFIPDSSSGNQGIVVNISPFKAEVKLANYKKRVCYFPCSVDVTSSYYITAAVEGFVALKRLYLVLAIDYEDNVKNNVFIHTDNRRDKYAVNVEPDPGSKPWLLINALTTHDDSNSSRNNPYNRHSSTNKKRPDGSEQHGAETFAEDKFHLKLPSNVDQYTGLAFDEDQVKELQDDLELPEDRFHRKDAASTFLINQRDQSRKDKIDKYEKEKEERKNDPNVEYVDMESLRAESEAERAQQQAKNGANNTAHAVNQDILKANSVLASKQKDVNKKGVISSNLWTELLD